MKNILITILIITIIGLTVHTYLNNDKITEPGIEYKYITDTITDSIPYPVPKPYKVLVPPKTVVEYITDPSQLDSIKVLLSEKDIIITSLQDSIYISQNFLKLFPPNPKLIGLGLSMDSLSLGLLNISGQISKKIWPLYLEKYNYKWDHQNGLSLKPTKIKYKTPVGYYIGGGMDFMFMSPYISGKMEKSWARINVYGLTQFGLLDNKTHKIQIGVYYKLNGKNIN